MTKQPVVGVHFGATYLEFEKSTLRDLVRAAGVGTIERQGSDGNLIWYLCFTDDTSALKSRIWVVSNVMGGPDFGAIELNAVSLGANDRASDSCPRLPPQLRPVALDRGVWIGTPLETLRRKLGPPSAMQNDWISFSFFGTLPGRYHGKVVNWDVLSVLSVQSSNGRVSALRANRLTSY